MIKYWIYEHTTSKNFKFLLNIGDKMTINNLIEILENYKHNCLNYEVKVNLDHCKSPNEFFFSIDDEEKTITIIQGNCGF